jgi:hypothetical protein
MAIWPPPTQYKLSTPTPRAGVAAAAAAIIAANFMIMFYDLEYSIHLSIILPSTKRERGRISYKEQRHHSASRYFKYQREDANKRLAKGRPYTPPSRID